MWKQLSPSQACLGELFHYSPSFLSASCVLLLCLIFTWLKRAQISRIILFLRLMFLNSFKLWWIWHFIIVFSINLWFFPVSEGGKDEGDCLLRKHSRHRSLRQRWHSRQWARVEGIIVRGCQLCHLDTTGHKFTITTRDISDSLCLCPLKHIICYIGLHTFMLTFLIES